MESLRRWLEPVALAVLLLGGFGMIVSTLLGTADVIGTQFFGQPVHGALEITESTMVVIVFGALTYSQIRRNHIRVELIYTRVGPRVQAGMDVFAHAMAILFFSLLFWQAFNEAQYSLQRDESTFGLIRIPLWPARIVLVVGTGLLILQLILDLIADVRRLVSGSEAVTAEDVIRREMSAADSLLDKDKP